MSDDDGSSEDVKPEEERTEVYRVPSPDLEMVVCVKALLPDEEKKIFMKFVDSLSKMDSHFDIDTYAYRLVKQLVHNYEDLYKECEDSQIGEQVALQVGYEAVTAIYGNLKIENICVYINNRTFQERLVAGENKVIRVPRPVNAPRKSVKTLTDINALESYLRYNVVGQDHAISELLTAIKLQVTGLEDRASFMFIGPTGVGKTKLASKLADRYYGNFFKIDCGVMGEGHEKASLLGSPPGYVGSGEKSLLSQKAEIGNNWIILFDEIEKAHPKFFDALLGLLDTGKITDNQGQELDFSKSIFIFTSNHGMQDLKTGQRLGFDNADVAYSDCTEDIDEALKKKFRPEFMNRLDGIVHFKELSPKDVLRIVRLELRAIPIIATKSLVEFIARGGYSREYGARNVQRFIKKNVSLKVADAILKGKVPKGKFFKPRVVGDRVDIVDTLSKDSVLEKTNG